jgi:hypothetical protein
VLPKTSEPRVRSPLFAGLPETGTDTVSSKHFSAVARGLGVTVDMRNDAGRENVVSVGHASGAKAEKGGWEDV